MSSATLDDLREATASFMRLHWPSGAPDTPDWHGQWPLRSPGPVPNHDKQGCYAIFEAGALIYIGLAASSGTGNYVGHGIGSRLYKHVLCIDWEASAKAPRCYKPQDRWLCASHLSTIGFPEQLSYLAPALEIYLIRHFSSVAGLQNKVSRSRANNSSKPTPLRGAA